MLGTLGIPWHNRICKRSRNSWWWVITLWGNRGWVMMMRNGKRRLVQLSGILHYRGYHKGRADTARLVTPVLRKSSSLLWTAWNTLSQTLRMFFAVLMRYPLFPILWFGFGQQQSCNASHTHYCRPWRLARLLYICKTTEEHEVSGRNSWLLMATIPRIFAEVPHWNFESPSPAVENDVGGFRIIKKEM